MKRQDLAMILLIASVSMMGSYFIANTIVGDASSKAVTIKTIDAINPEVDEPDQRIFNKDAVNPTVEVFIGGNGQ